MSKEIKVTDLSNYFEELNKIDSQKYYFRGESERYNKITASIFRNNNIKEGPNKLLELMLNDFYREIAYDLGQVEKDNFLSYSQHHGLPTNLIDITTSPVNAAFFASDSYESSENCQGYIHLFRKQDSLTLNEELQGTDVPNFLEEIRNKNPKFIKYLYIQISRIGLAKLLDLLYDTLSSIVKKNMKPPYSLTFTDSTPKEEYILELEIIENFYNKFPISSLRENHGKNTSARKLLSAIHKPLMQNSRISNSFNEFSNILAAEFGEKRNIERNIIVWYLYFVWYSLEHFNNLPSLPLFVYKPSINFDRMKSQDGLFLYQNSVDRGSNDFESQLIQPSITFVLENKKKFYKQLDNIGINRLKLFHDADNIAEYIKSRYKY